VRSRIFEAGFYAQIILIRGVEAFDLVGRKPINGNEIDHTLVTLWNSVL
jgi:hypothetical protein